LEDGNVVVFHDADSQERRCTPYLSGTKGHPTYNGVAVKGLVHIHPYVNDGFSNPLQISSEDIYTANYWGFDDINILLPNGDYYRQGLEGNTLFFPNPVGNINDKKF